MEKRSLFSRIFKTEQDIVFGQDMKLLNNYSARFTTYDGSLYDNQTVRSCIDTIARNGAKLSAKHLRQKDGVFNNLDSNIKKLISERPNELMNAYDFYYKVISQLMLNNNSFVWVERDDKNIAIALWPIKAGTYEVLEYGKGIFIRFKFTNGKSYTASYNDVIHLRRFYCENDVLGGGFIPLINSLETQHTLKEGITNAIKTTAGLKGIIKTTKAMLKSEDIKKTRDAFVRDFIESDSSNGIAGLDATSDFVPVSLDPKTATDKQMDDIKFEILEYFGISEKMLKATYTEEEWNAFYESVIEPIAIQMGTEFSNKIFTATERGFGNKVIFEANRLAYASNKTKVDIARYMNNYLTVNEVREIFNLAPRDDGDKILQDLNHIDDSIANDYQGGVTDETTE